MADLIGLKPKRVRRKAAARLLTHWPVLSPVACPPIPPLNISFLRLGFDMRFYHTSETWHRGQTWPDIPG